MSRSPNKRPNTSTSGSGQRYSSPTRSSMMKMKPAANLRERVKDINERIDTLNSNQDATADASEQNYISLQHQIKSLRNAFTELGDNFLKEMVGLRNELCNDFKTEIDGAHSRINDLTDQVAHLREDKNQQGAYITNLESRVSAQIKALQDQNKALESDLYKTKFELNQTREDLSREIADNKYNTQAQFEKVNAELERLSNKSLSADHQIASLSTNLGNHQNKTEYSQDKSSHHLNELSNSLADLANSFSKEKASTYEKTSQLNEKLKEITEVFLSRVEVLDGRVEERMRGLRQENSILEQRMSVGLADVEKNTSYDVHSKMQNVSEVMGEDARQLARRLRDVEGEIKNVLTTVSSVERSYCFKNDNIVRAIQTMSRQLNLPSPIHN